MQQIIKMALLGKSYIEGLFQREEGQDVFEYILIVAGISVVIIAIAAVTVPDLFDAVLEALCNAINGIPGMDIADCAGLGGS